MLLWEWVEVQKVLLDKTRCIAIWDNYPRGREISKETGTIFSET